VLTLTINGNSADLSGYLQLNGERVTFIASVVDGNPVGIPDSLSLTLSNGYSLSGDLVSGEINIY
jgi:hypothetical protein